MKTIQQKILILITLLAMLLCYNYTNCSSAFLLTIAPNNDSIIVNNESKNNENNIANIALELSNNNIEYSFKKEEVNEKIEEFKLDYIKTINSYLSQNKYTVALNYLNTYYHLFEDDSLINSLKTSIESTLTSLKYTPYKGDVEVVSFSPLISYPKQIFNNRNPNAKDIDNSHITINEFEKILKSLYENNFILISPNDILNENNLNLPQGKKPLLLILNSAHYSTKNGGVDKLILNNNNTLSTYTPKRAINDRIHDNNDFITILLNFIDSHPSFAHNNSKALIVINNNNGMFGYKTQRTNATSKYEIKKALEIINYLKSKGFVFASGEESLSKNNSFVNFANNIEKWHKEISPIIGETNIFFNNSINNDNIDEKLNLLKQYNYRLIIAIEDPPESLEPIGISYLKSLQVNGNTLRNNNDDLAHLFDCEKVYDHINRHTPYNNT